MLITRETKLKIVKKHLKDGVTLRELSEQFHIHTSNIKYYDNIYMITGEPDYQEKAVGTNCHIVI